MITQKEYNLLNHFKFSWMTGLTVQEIKDNKLDDDNELNTLLAKGLIGKRDKDKPITCSSALSINKNGFDAIILYERNERKFLSQVKQWFRRKYEKVQDQIC